MNTDTMIFDERNRDAKLLIEAGRARKMTSEQSLQAFFDMNNAMLRICIESIKAEKPRISEKNLLKEVKRAYSFRP